MGVCLGFNCKGFGGSEAANSGSFTSRLPQIVRRFHSPWSQGIIVRVRESGGVAPRRTESDRRRLPFTCLRRSPPIRPVSER